jgi:hypothetical protein
LSADPKRQFWPDFPLRLFNLTAWPIEFGEMCRSEFGGRYSLRICPNRRFSKVTIFC